ncbi:GNAT family N-acetyltransferase [Rathayibacter sp. VKM Ac-2760]|uniref:GNAT family N-acetyltransferase n=1 Tax=Rathayibacter sp. VKM Ac-2760 TaxID=2609253 RepID=UPI001319B78F|nr:GNAT family N-acetyltransferase [Rathayibacter sp. VKM Ac-2760]QHC58148.1 GNAT family N-acetyltransferase [Rathayibacter sp. VKM Ac-2760]
MLPSATARLHFREMTEADLDLLAELLGDAAVMRYYPAPKTREEAVEWIAWNRRNYERDGVGLWIIETAGGDFVGDCGLTWQSVNGVPELEVGYHVRSSLHGRGYATEAAAACLELARRNGLANRLVAIVHPENTASRRVAEKIGLRVAGEERDGGPLIRIVLATRLAELRPPHKKD